MQFLFKYQDAGSSAKNFQITHSRLCSLQSMMNLQPAHIYNPKYLVEPEVVELLLEIAKLPDVLYESKRILGAQRLLNYTAGLK